ncbi:MAG: hypothetical protein GY822_17105 [Deltaproteobacteria bacterium]|nr:hypothetical protein [Deltaproteobacteria bacterium]
MNKEMIDGLALERVVLNFDEGRILEAKVSDPPIFEDASVQINGLSDGDHKMLIDEISEITGGGTGRGVLERKGSQVFFNGDKLAEQDANKFYEVLYFFNPLLQI